VVDVLMQTLSDGVEVLSLSLGAPKAQDYFEDVIAIGSFHAVASGIVIMASAGNSGPLQLHQHHQVTSSCLSFHEFLFPGWTFS